MRIGMSLSCGLLLCCTITQAWADQADDAEKQRMQSQLNKEAMEKPFFAEEPAKVYVNIRSGVMEFDRNAMSRVVKESFAGNANGYTITDDPDEAQFQLNIFVVTLEKASPTAAEIALKQGYRGDVNAGATAGMAVGAYQSHTWTGGVVGGVIGALGTTAANAFVQDVTYMLVADVQIKEKAAKGVLVRKDSRMSARVSDGGTSTQSVSEASDNKEYRTRIVTTANKSNLELSEAQDLMFKKTSYALAGFF